VPPFVQALYTSKSHRARIEHGTDINAVNWVLVFDSSSPGILLSGHSRTSIALYTSSITSTSRWCDERPSDQTTVVSVNISRLSQSTKVLRNISALNETNETTLRWAGLLVLRRSRSAPKTWRGVLSSLSPTRGMGPPASSGESTARDTPSQRK
jgi:hypothetical protein